MKTPNPPPGNDLEVFLDEHGQAAIYHPDFLGRFKNSEIYILANAEKLPTGQLAIALDVDRSGGKLIVYAYSSRSALESSLKNSHHKSVKYAALPGSDVLKMLVGKANIRLNSSLPSQIEFENLGS